MPSDELIVAGSPAPPGIRRNAVRAAPGGRRVVRGPSGDGWRGRGRMDEAVFAGGPRPFAVPDPLRAALTAPLVNQSCLGVLRDDLPRTRFELLVTGSGCPAPPGTTHFDTVAGIAVRRWCAPVLDLEPHAPAAVYLARRQELGAEEVNRRLLRAAGLVSVLVDTGRHGPDLLTPPEMGGLGAAAADEVVRLERVEREVAAAGPAAAGYIAALAAALAAEAVHAVGLASSAACRTALPGDPARPARGAVIAAAGERLARSGEPLADSVLLRHLMWTAVDVARERGIPIQLHTGGGEPARLAGFLRAVRHTGVPFVLLDCYPRHREAARLAADLPHVYLDVGPGSGCPAAGFTAALGEVVGLAPFHKQLFGSGGHVLAELCHLGVLSYRRGLARFLAARVADGEWSTADAARVAHLIGSDNARRVYRL
ncbi:amidohydrolase family protein [Rhizohabitans arisaemae]|uniref:amidohydrolase family protein n=1 Tax=Rhizohabitans arisaemae TaxID=2720610 RepID=UPI0024B0C8FF|nr:amidohydrolase family protein [Rhizohabitans arisaemae]